MHAGKTKTGCFQGKTIPQTEHKKHYRTLRIGEVWGVCPRVGLCFTSPSYVLWSAFRFGFERSARERKSGFITQLMSSLRDCFLP